WSKHEPARTAALASSRVDDATSTSAEPSAPATDSTRAPASASAPRGVVAGRLLDRAGNASAGGQVELRERAARGLALRFGEFARHEHVVGTATSDADGVWRAEVPAERVLDVDVRASGFGLERVGDVLAGEELVLRLERAAALVLDVRGTDGEPRER